jgi:hypothetical protein
MEVHLMHRPANRKPLNPIHGIARWIHPPILPCEATLAGLPGLLHVETARVGTVYMVTVHVAAGAVTGYRLTKPDGTKYDIDALRFTCDCPDATFNANRPGGCKHARALRAALREIGVRVSPDTLQPVPLDGFTPGRDDEPALCGSLAYRHFDSRPAA